MLFEKPVPTPTPWNQILQQKEWTQLWCRQEEVLQEDFFGTTFDVRQLLKSLQSIPVEQWRRWGEYGFEPHVFPSVDFTMDSSFPGWKKQPYETFWSKGNNGEFCRKTSSGPMIVDTDFSSLAGSIVLVDRCAVEEETFDDAWVGSIMQSLRRETKTIEEGIKSIKNPSTRFGATRKEWEEHIRPTLETNGSFPGEIRLERLIESNVIPQLFPHLPRNNKQTMFFHVEECHPSGESSYIHGSDIASKSAGEIITIISRDAPSPIVAFRPLIVIR